MNLVTLYVSDLRANLTSIVKITRKDNKIVFKKGKAIIIGKCNEVKLKAQHIGNLYYIQKKSML